MAIWESVTCLSRLWNRLSAHALHLPGPRRVLGSGSQSNSGPSKPLSRRGADDRTMGGNVRALLELEWVKKLICHLIPMQPFRSEHWLISVGAGGISTPSRSVAAYQVTAGQGLAHHVTGARSPGEKGFGEGVKSISKRGQDCGGAETGSSAVEQGLVCSSDETSGVCTTTRLPLSELYCTGAQMPIQHVESETEVIVRLVPFQAAPRRSTGLGFCSSKSCFLNSQLERRTEPFSDSPPCPISPDVFGAGWHVTTPDITHPARGRANRPLAQPTVPPTTRDLLPSPWHGLHTHFPHSVVADVRNTWSARRRFSSPAKYSSLGIAEPPRSVLLYPVVYAVEETLMDTKWATTELAWTSHPETGWEEVSGYDDAMNPIRTYQVCNVRELNQNNWLRSDFIPRKDVLRVYVEMKFTVRDCNSIPNIPGSCKETFNLFYYESDSDSATATSPFWMENPYVKVDTIAPDESFSMLESGRVNTKVRSFGPLSKAGFYLAFQDLGACMSLISVRVFYKKCSTTIANFAVFPETATGAEATSLVIAPGTCVPNALEVSVPLKLYCNGDGEWMVPVGSCTCSSGFEAAIKETQCQACSPGTFKSKQGEGSCFPCPANSRASSGAASICSCRNGFYRSDTDSPDSPCTTVPSPPRSVISNVNETSLVLEWSDPRESGGRDDIFYNVICKKCLPERGMCSRCDDNVEISPRHLGLVQRRVAVRNLQAHTQYSFEIQAVNGVSNKSPYAAQFSAVNITTNQAAPSAVPTVHLMAATANSMSLSWLPPEKPNGIILDYEIKYHEKDAGEAIAHTMTAQRSSARIEGLNPRTSYVVQVRARTVAGYGRYSSPTDFSTNLQPEPEKSIQEQLPLIVGLATASLVVLIAVVVVAIVCLKKQRNGSESEYTEKLQQYITPGMKVYIDPFTYEDPNEAVREFAKEIDVSCVKIEEVIGA
ncbi:unnamed protein product, partial [Gadus morhua 'NCC']